MTKEEELELEIYKRLDGDGNIKKILEKFFSQNVCIPKGDNRHPYADVYHEAVEGKPWQWSEDGINWFDVVPPLYQYRIKPSEPIYEWQWKYKYKIPYSESWHGFTTHKTEKEFKNDLKDFLEYEKDESTKREHK